MLQNAQERSIPYLFKKGPESTAVSEATERLTCPVAGATYIRKLLDAQAASEAPAKKRARCPELDAAEKPAKKAKAKAKGKAKPKAKSGAKASLQEGETETVLEEDVTFAMESATMPEGCRQRLWLDDLLAAMRRCMTGPFAGEGLDTWLRQEGGVFPTLVSYGLEFALTGSVRLQKKVVKEWSKAQSSQVCVSLWVKS